MFFYFVDRVVWVADLGFGYGSGYWVKGVDWVLLLLGLEGLWATGFWF